MAYLDTQIVSASIQEIGGGLSASSDELSWIQSSYLIAEIIVIPLSAWLSCVMSTRWLLAASAAGFTLASVLCGSASDMRAMIVFRGASGLLRRLDDSDCVHGRRRLVSRQTKGRRSDFRQCRWRSCADARSSRRRLAYRWLVMALVVLGMLVTLLVPMLVRVDEPDLTLLRGADYPGMILMAPWGDSTAGQAAGLKKLWLLTYREAQVQAFADAYLAIALCFAVSVVPVPLMHKVAQSSCAIKLTLADFSGRR